MVLIIGLIIVSCLNVETNINYDINVSQQEIQEQRVKYESEMQRMDALIKRHNEALPYSSEN